MKASLFFIVVKETDELIVDRAFKTAKDAENYLKDSMLNKKAVQIKEAVYTIKDKKK